MLEEYFTHFPTIKFDFLDEAYDELTTANFYRSATGQNRSDCSSSLRAKFQEILPFNIYCCGFFRNIPDAFYPVHKDVKRLCALNILVCDPSDKFEAVVFDDKKNRAGLIDYKRDIPVLLNTKRYHCIYNGHQERARFVLSIGCVDESYETVKAKLHDHFHTA